MMRQERRWGFWRSRRRASPAAALLPRWGAARTVCLVIVGLLASVTMALAQRPAALALDGVTVIDVETGQRVRDQTVLLAGNRIQAIGLRGAIRVPRGARRVAARGKYLIPGLWDMHSHPMCFADVFYSLLIANGVTGIRDPGTQVPLDTLRRWRREIAAGARIGPRMVVSGSSLDDYTAGLASFGLPFCGSGAVNLQVRTPVEGRHLVDSLARAGADFIKVHNLTSRTVYFAIAAEARRIGIPFSGHLPDSVTAIEASDSGQRAIDHFNTGPNLRALCLDDSASVQSCAPVAARFRRNGTWFVPTMVQAFGSGGGTPSDSLAARFNARLREFTKYWPDSVLKALPSGLFTEASLARRDSIADSVSAALRHATHASHAGVLRVVHDTGLPVLAGTDAAVLFLPIAPGFSLHAELTLLVAEGLTPLEALQAATLNPARFLDATDSLGTIAPGKLADLVLLDADPLADIANTARIRAVVADGRYLDRAALDRLKAHVVQAAQTAQTAHP